MSEEALSPEAQEKLNAAASQVAESLAQGQSRSQVTAQLVESGWTQEASDQLVGEVEQHLSQAESKGEGSGMGWLIWIGLLLLINLLSYLFNWGFWLY